MTMPGIRFGSGNQGISTDYMPMSMYGVQSTPEDYINLGDGIGAPTQTLGRDWLTASPDNFGGSKFGSLSMGGSDTPNKSGLFSSFLQGKNADNSTYGGYGQVGLGIAQGLGSMYMGLRQYGLAKDQLAFGKEQFNKNYAAQQTTTNTALEDRQAARVGANKLAYKSVSEYMNKNRIV